MAELRACAPSDYVVIDTPFKYNKRPIRVTVNKALRVRFLRACRKAKRRSARRRILGSNARRIRNQLRQNNLPVPKWVRNKVTLRGWLPRRIDSYVCRVIAGTSTWSQHARAAAWDFFITAPGVAPPGGVWTPNNGVPAWFAQPFEKEGFTWGARWARKDVPHIEQSGTRV